MSKNNKFSPEVRERAVRLVQEHRGEYPSQWAAVQSIAPKIGCSGYTLLKWVQLQEVEAGTRPGVPQAEQERIKALEREVKELRRANEIVAAILDDTLPSHITLFDLAVDPPALWDEQRERVGL